MNPKKVVLISVFIISFVSFSVFAEEPAPAAEPTVVAPADNAPKGENEMQWAWGEVTAVDPAAKTVTLKYLDYENDQEKELVVSVDEKTIYENISGIDEIKVNDTLSIDYAAKIDGKNIAKNISLEKKEAAVPAAPIVTDSVASNEVTAADTVASASVEAAPAETLSAPVEETQVPADTAPVSVEIGPVPAETPAPADTTPVLEATITPAPAVDDTQVQQAAPAQE